MTIAVQSKEDRDTRQQEVLVSGEYSGVNTETMVIEHSALVAPGNEWKFDVKCRPIGDKQVHERSTWRSVKEVCPDASVELKHNEIELTFPAPRKDLVFATFGTAGKEDKKRMQMAIFGGTPVQGRNWKITVYLLDDTIISFKSVCKREEERGHKLLTTLAGLFVSNSSEDITIDFSSLEDGWKIKGSSIQKIKSRNAWNSPANSTDFPRCVFEIKHVDKTKRSFFGGITASHETDDAKAEIVAHFQQERNQRDKLNQHSTKPTQPTQPTQPTISGQKERNEDQLNQHSKKLTKPTISGQKMGKEKTVFLPVFLFLMCWLFSSGLNARLAENGTDLIYDSQRKRQQIDSRDNSPKTKEVGGLLFNLSYIFVKQTILPAGSVIAQLTTRTSQDGHEKTCEDHIEINAFRIQNPPTFN